MIGQTVVLMGEPDYALVFSVTVVSIMGIVIFVAALAYVLYENFLKEKLRKFFRKR
jgi:hypothetical protein